MQDADGDAASLTFSITVNEPAPAGNQQRDLLPTFGSASVSGRTFTVGQSVRTVTLPAASGGNAPLTYSLTPDLPAGLTFNAKTRAITGAPMAAQDSTEYTYTATDADGDTATLTFTITVAADLTPTFGAQTVSDQTYTVGQSVGTVSMPAASGGDGAVTYTLSPALPAGLSFNASNRRITGTPTTALAARGYTYTATDADGDTATLTFTITVAADLTPTFGTQTIANQTYTVGQDIGTVTLPAASGGNAPLTYSLSPTLPAGLTFNASARTITGAPMAAQDSTEYTYTATDADGDTATLNFSITVAADLTPTFGTQTIADQTYTAGEDIGTVTLPGASSGNAPLTCSLSPALPAGLTFNAKDPAPSPAPPRRRRTPRNTPTLCGTRTVTRCR